jgi:KUP system potassium uptake protein
VIVIFLLVDLAFFSANALKIANGGWFPLLIGVVFYVFMTTWKKGRALLGERLREEAVPIDDFIQRLASGSALRVPGTAVFLSSNPQGVPNTLLHNLRHNKVVHERVVLLTVLTEDIPQVADENRVQVQDMGHNFYRIIVHYGFVEDPNIVAALDLCANQGLKFDLMDTTFFLGRETLIPAPRPGMALWRESLFMSMSRNAARAMDFFRIPHNRVVELGTQVEL